MKKVLSIAGSDSIGGAGIQADIKTITAHRVYAMTVVTAVTAQNTLGVWEVAEMTPEFVGQQIDCVFQDIVPDSVKVGMVARGEIISVIADRLVRYRAGNIVLDPVMVSTSGSKLMADDAKDVYIRDLLPLATIITPNLSECAVLSGMDVHTKADMMAAAKEIATMYHGAILIKGGHLEEDASDLLYINGEMRWFEEERINNPNTHGTGCTLSSAIACHLAAGHSIEKSVALSKQYVTGALRVMLNMGKGSGPLDHTHCWNSDPS